jgi:Uncharacterised nucleotidyltransferase
VDRTFTFDPQLRLLAAALAGDEASLQTLANSSELQPQVLANRLAPTLAIHATDLGIEGPEVEVWMRHMRHNAVFRMRLETARRTVGEVFAECDIPWTPLKGMGLDPRIHERPEARISTDLDVLVSPGHSLPARDHLVSLGWRSTETTARSMRYVADEGYNWHLGSPDGLALELHFRLWGGVSEEFAAGILDRTQPAPEFGTTARRIDLTDSYLIAAVHVWQTPSPRYLALWWDLHRMADTMADHEIQDAITRADRHGLHAFVSASAGTAADLWNNPNNQFIAKELGKNLRPSERWAAAALRRSSPATASLGVLTLGRLLANRPSRSGWRALPRQIWAHPGTVEAGTPDTWSWPRRRLTHVARNLHLTKK